MTDEFIVERYHESINIKPLLNNGYGEYVGNKQIDKFKAQKLKYNEVMEFAANHPQTCFYLRQGNVTGFLGFQLLDWDSEYFGFKVAMLNYLITSEDDYENDFLIKSHLLSFFEEWCKKAGVKLAYSRSANEDLAFIHALEAQGFRYMENRFHLYLPKSKFKKPEARKEIEIVDFSPEYSEKILSLVPDALKISRFHKDPLTREKADAVYLNWTRNALEDLGKKKLVMKVNGKFAGFFFYYLRNIKELSQRSLWWDLAILSPEFRGKGLGCHFYAYIADKEKDQVDFAEGKFSLSNDSVLKIMSQLKASLVHSELTYHKHF